MQLEIYSGFSEDGKEIQTKIGDYTIINDSPLKPKEDTDRHASQGQLFLAGATACAAAVALRFCMNHDLPLLKGIRNTVEITDHWKSVSQVNYVLEVPKDFPEDRLEALIRAAGTCTVKGFWQNPPEFVTTTEFVD